MQNDFALFRRRFLEYADTFAEADGSFSLPVLRKREHTDDVCSITSDLARRSNCAEEETFRFLVCALFHDVSRFEQFKKFHTFRDAASFDHGCRSAELFLTGNFVPELSEPDRILAADAIRVHNKLAIPADFPRNARRAAEMLRDADKLSILKLVYAFFTDPAKGDPTMKLDLPTTPGFTPGVLQFVLRGESVPHKNLRNVNDFILTLFSWACDYNFPAASSYALENELYPKLRTLLPESAELDGMLEKTLERLHSNEGKRS